MSNYASKEFWKGAAERALRTAAQTAIALIGTDQVGLLALDWAQIASVTATATLLSVLMSIAGGGTGSGPSFTNAEEIPAEEDGGSNVVGEEAFFDDQDEVVEDNAPEVLDELEEHKADEQAALDAQLAAEVDDTPPPEDYQPRH
ncbi:MULTISPECIES: holin [unclassified Brevibacterium]|uniref:holin n=1 Tax=unclassified Brevibacterium TaxID=2614124 RepID=UPI001E53B791|nr:MULTISPECIES: holin [unclassified Brevibacterium]MCD1285250.1 hypothetical protein [Brevibacterium sp. CCUG 69071]MDK8434294.1 holin [Brevibacterium sp. H-BE7]